MPDAPSPEECEWLLDRLAELVRERGDEPFLDAPIVDDAARSFPDPWTHDAAGVQVVARRLMWHAGLEDYRARVLDVRGHGDGLGDEELRDTHVWFSQLRDHSAEFELASVGNDDIIGILSHEIGRVYREVHRLDDAGGHPFRDPWHAEDSRDEHLIDSLSSLTAVYLGLGKLATNASHRARHGGTIQGHSHSLSWSHTMAGGLPPRAMSYLCAVQAVVREDEAAFSGLAANHAALFRAWCDELRDDRAELSRRLGISRPEAGRALVTRAQAARFTDEHYDAQGALTEVERTRFNTGHPVFRVRYNRVSTYAALGAVAGIALSAAGIFAGLATVGIGAASLVVVASAIMGTRSYYHRCSDPQCSAFIEPGDHTCPRCGGMVVGELDDANKRLQALEAWEEEQGLLPGGDPDSDH